MPQIDTDLVTQADYARHRGCTREAVRRALQSGRITAFGADQRINVELADVQWSRNTRPRMRPATTTTGPTVPAGSDHPAPSHSGGETVGTYGHSRERREYFAAMTAQMEFETAARKLL